MCKWWVKDGVHVLLAETDRTAISVENECMAGEALRVLGFANAEQAPADSCC